jgi:transposase-like protein
MSFSEENIRQFFIAHGVIKSETQCGKCGNRVCLKEGDWHFRCTRRVSINKKKAATCGWWASARTGSFVEKSRLPIVTLWRLVTYFLYHNPPRQPFLVENLDVSNRTVVDWFSFVREVYLDHLLSTSVRLGGPGKIVEIDEAKFGKRKYNRGRRVKGNWVLGGIQRDTRQSFLVRVQDRTRRTLIREIRRAILPGTTIITDCWKSYSDLVNYGFTHLTVTTVKLTWTLKQVLIPTPLSVVGVTRGTGFQNTV